MPPLQDPVEEAKRIIQAAKEKGVTLRLLGGVGFYFRCPSARQPSLSRRYVDMDFMAHAKQSKGIKQLFVGLGYVPRDLFNAMQGYKRLIFNDIEHQRRVDVFLDEFKMCHNFNFKNRMELDDQTIPIADLLATKLQIVEINEKDMKDILTVFLDFDVSKTDSNAINGDYLAKLSSDDWGIYKTFMTNLNKILASVGDHGLDDAQKEKIIGRMNQLKKMIEESPKSFRWKMRARVGENVKWYELPEADKEVVDSRMSTNTAK